MLQELIHFLPVAEKIIVRKTTLPILTHVCVSDGFIRATDLETTVRIPVEDDRSYTMPLSILKQVMLSRPKLLEVDLLGDEKVRITYDSKSIAFPSLDVEEFPMLPKGRFKPVGIWTKDVFKSLYGQLTYCSTDELKPALTGVYVDQNSSLSSCATDGHVLRLVRNIDPDSNCRLKNNFQCILPRKSLMILARTAAGNIRVAHKDGYLRFALKNGLEIYVRFIDEKYPDIESVIPKKFTGETVFDKSAMLDLISDGKPFANRETKQAAFEIGKNEITLTVEDPEKDIKWESSLPAVKQSGDDTKIGMNLILLEKILKGVQGSEAAWRYSSPISASVFSSCNGSLDEAINLIMPIRLNDSEENNHG